MGEKMNVEGQPPKKIFCGTRHRGQHDQPCKKPPFIAPTQGLEDVYIDIGKCVGAAVGFQEGTNKKLAQYTALYFKCG